MALHVPTMVPGPPVSTAMALGPTHSLAQLLPAPRPWERRTPHASKTLTMVVSVTEPKLLMKMLHVTLTGGPEKQCEASSWCQLLRRVHSVCTRGDTGSGT